jgi:hypothetical protein
VSALLVSRTSPSRHTPRGYFSLYPFQIRNGRAFLWISLQDFLECRERDCIFVVVDRLTKFAHFFSIPMDYKAIQVVRYFSERFFGCMVYPGR